MCGINQAFLNVNDPYNVVAECPTKLSPLKMLCNDRCVPLYQKG